MKVETRKNSTGVVVNGASLRMAFNLWGRKPHGIAYVTTEPQSNSSGDDQAMGKSLRFYYRYKGCKLYLETHNVSLLTLLIDSNFNGARLIIPLLVVSNISIWEPLKPYTS